jgi:hypothetical protein
LGFKKLEDAQAAVEIMKNSGYMTGDYIIQFAGTFLTTLNKN